MKTLILCCLLLSSQAFAHYNTNYDLYLWERSTLYQNNYPVWIVDVTPDTSTGLEDLNTYKTNNVKPTSNGDNLHEILTFGDE